MSRSETTYRVGDRLGPYELVAKIGKGGFASVWSAKRAGPGGFEAKVALKLIHADLASDPGFQKMFIDEAKVAALIDHPNVVKIYELGVENDTLYMVMEHVRGRPLSVLRNLAEHEGRPIPPEIVMRAIADTCAGLHAAHELTRDGKPLHVIHRDISPENILISDKGVVKLIDFGVAKAADRLATETNTGLAKGKVRYMAPEQALAKPLDRRVDIWALGAVTFDLIEGHPPFDGPNDVARLYALAGTDPAPPLTRAVPRGFEGIIASALSRDVEDRFATAAEMHDAIERALESLPSRVGSEALVNFFGPWLSPEALLEEEPSQSERLRRKLRNPKAEAATGTQEVLAEPMELTSSDAMVPKVETLAALNSAAVLSNAPRRRAPLVVGSVVAVCGGILAWALISPGPAPTSAAPSPAQLAPAPVSNEPERTPNVAPSTEITLDDVDAATASEENSTDAGPRRPSARPARAHPRPIAPKKPRPNRPPRYDDTIQ